MPDSNLLERRARALTALNELGARVIRDTESYDLPPDVHQRVEKPTDPAAMCSEVMSLLGTTSWGHTIQMLETMTARDL